MRSDSDPRGMAAARSGFYRRRDPILCDPKDGRLLTVRIGSQKFTEDFKEDVLHGSLRIFKTKFDFGNQIYSYWMVSICYDSLFSVPLRIFFGCFRPLLADCPLTKVVSTSS